MTDNTRSLMQEHLNKSETRFSDYYYTTVDQKVISWCTTHDKSSTYGKSCAVATDDGPVCVISSGGPDHKWWQDA